MQFDLESNRAYFETDEETGINERLALRFPLGWRYVDIGELYRQLRRRQQELQEAHHSHKNPDYRAQAIVQMVDAHLQSVLPDLYVR